MIEMNLMRKEGENADLSKWYFGTSDELGLALAKEVAEILDVVFSENGANAAIGFDDNGGDPGELRLHCEIDLEEFVAYASAQTTLSDLVMDYVSLLEEDGINRVADALRSLADKISKGAKCQK